MPYGLYLVEVAEIERAVQARGHSDGSGIVLGHAEGVELGAREFFDLVGLGIVAILTLPEHPVHSVADRRIDVQILEQLEVGQADAEIVRHAVLELVEESLLPEFRSLEVDLVLQCGIVAQRELLIKTLLANPLLALEGVEGADGECYVRQGEGVR